MPPVRIQTVAFGKTGRTVTRAGLGGEGILRTHTHEREARVVVEEAVHQGITYFDSARVYADSELYYGSFWGQKPEIRRDIFQADRKSVV